MARALVLNATGKVSAGVIDTLVAQGHEVVAASRHPKGAHRGVHAVHFDYADPSTFDAALHDVDRLFWVSPPLVLDGYTHTKSFFARALPKVEKVVVMTASGVEHSDAIPMRKTELLIEGSGVAWTHIRPTWFMDNFHTFWLEPMRRQGLIPLPAAESQTAFVDARDIAAAGAAALYNAKTDSKAYAITGSESLTYADAARIISEASGRQMRYVAIDDDAFVAGAVTAGLSEPYARMLAVLFAAVRDGAAAQVTTAVRDLTGSPPRTLASYAHEHAAAWRT
ncbi:MAG: NmrA family NAD(P)-binding protein, partial [Clostridia bacterium]|nr:NmrA family NAD(P)-binding protein [Deltaproteobacteria bacterium]